MAGAEALRSPGESRDIRCLCYVVPYIDGGMPAGDLLTSMQTLGRAELPGLRKASAPATLPIGIRSAETNFYRAEGDNPTNRVDPTGLFDWEGSRSGALGGLAVAFVLNPVTPPVWIAGGIIGGIVGGISPGAAGGATSGALTGGVVGACFGYITGGGLPGLAVGCTSGFWCGLGIGFSVGSQEPTFWKGFKQGAKYGVLTGALFGTLSGTIYAPIIVWLIENWP